MINPAFVGSKSSGGYTSPQWGWYISTTPPVEKFVDKNKKNANKKKKKKKNSVEETASDEDKIPVENVDEEKDNVNDTEDRDEKVPTFTKGVKGMGKIGRVGWHVC